MTALRQTLQPLGILALLGVLLAVGSAAADETAKARALQQVQQGVSLYDAKRYDEALDAFHAAYAIYPSPKILFNLGQCYSSMGRKADAAESYEQFMELAKVDPSLAQSEFAKAAQERLNQLSAGLGRIQFQVEPADAQHQVDGAVVSTQVVFVTPGKHVAGASKPGFRDEQLSIDVGKGSQAVVGLSLQALPPAVAAVAEPTREVPPEKPPEPPAQAPTPAPPVTASAPVDGAPRASRMPAILTTVGAGVLAAGSLTMGGLTLSQYQALPTNPMPYTGSGSLSPAEQTELRDARIADGLLVGTAIVGAVATYLWLSGGQSTAAPAN